jgi:hypothetical protein
MLYRSRGSKKRLAFALFILDMDAYYHEKDWHKRTQMFFACCMSSVIAKREWRDLQKRYNSIDILTELWKRNETVWAREKEISWKIFWEVESYSGSLKRKLRRVSRRKQSFGRKLGRI